MKVYRIENDRTHYQYFLPAVDEDPNRLHMTGDFLVDEGPWVSPRLSIANPDAKAGDFYQPDGSSLILSPAAADVLWRHVQIVQEAVSLKHDGEVYWMLNLEIFNCLHGRETIWETDEQGMRLRPQQYAFHTNRFPESDIFKIPETYESEVLVVEREPSHGFLPDLARYNLQGYTLTLLWDSEAV